jgi:hypothetical protein
MIGWFYFFISLFLFFFFSFFAHCVGIYTSALKDFRTAVSVAPARVSVWLLIALIYLSHYHDFQAAVLACDKVHEVSDLISIPACVNVTLYRH